MTRCPRPPRTTRGLLTAARQPQEDVRVSGELPLGRQIVLQVILLLITVTVLFPLVWIVSMALDPRNLARPDGLNLIPPGASLDAFAKVIAQPTSNPISFIELALNSMKIAIVSAAIAVAHRDPRRLRVLAAQVPRPGSADDRSSSAC